MDILSLLLLPFYIFAKKQIHGKHYQKDKNVLSGFRRSIGGTGVPFRKMGVSGKDNHHPGRFSREGDAVCGSCDLYHRTAGFEYVETLEETTAYSISVEQLDELYRSYIDLANWMRVLQQENFLWLQDMHIRRLNWSAQERYEHLTKECPELFQRVNLGYIASFLGITQQSLSRIRANGRFFNIG